MSIKKRKWLYVGRIKAGTTANMVINNLRDRCGTEDVVCSLANNDDVCAIKTQLVMTMMLCCVTKSVMLSLNPHLY